MGLLIDYQNIHLTARDRFAPPGTDARATLVHPTAFAERTLRIRATAAPGAAEIVSIALFRGVPSNARQPLLYAASHAQRAHWTRDARVCVHYRTLRYGNWPKEPPREKGVDVHLAIELVRAAYLTSEVDVAIVATHDTDLEPALAMAAASGRIGVETVGWACARRLRVPGHALRHTTLGRPDFLAARDTRDYWSRT